MSGLSLNTHWLNSLCHKLGDVLGVEFTIHNSADESESHVPPSHVLWQKPLRDGQEIAGHLRIQAKPESLDLNGRDHSGRIVDAANVIADIVERMAAVERRLHFQLDDEAFEQALYKSLTSQVPTEIVHRLLAVAQAVTDCWGTAFFLRMNHGQTLRLRQCSSSLSAVSFSSIQRVWDSSPDAIAARQGIEIVSAPLATSPWLPESVESGAVVPVTTQDGCIGSLWSFDRRQRLWSQRDQRVLQKVAMTLGQALERAALLKESESRRRISRELHSASARHPGKAVGELSAELGLDIAIRTESPSELGGDLCEVWPIGSGRTFFAIGDATGHSVPAAMIMAVARGSLRTLLSTDLVSRTATGQIATHLNRALHSVTQGEQFLTFACGIFDRQQGCLTYTNGGHPQPWLIREGKGISLETHGMILGVLPDSHYSQTQLQLQKHDWLICYTDGITEAISRQRELFRPSGILDVMTSGHRPDAASAADAIWQAVSHHREGRPSNDDQTLLVMRVR